MNYADTYPQCSDCDYLKTLQAQRDAHIKVADTSEITAIDVGLDIVSSDIAAAEMTQDILALSAIIEDAKLAGTLSDESEKRYITLMNSYRQQLNNLANIADNLSSVANLHAPIIDEMMTIVRSLDESAVQATEHCDTRPQTRALTPKACYSVLAFTQQ
jgi:hypothetical protein